MRHEPHIPVTTVSSRHREHPGSCPDSKAIARTVLQRAQQHTLSSAHTAADSRGDSGAPVKKQTRPRLFCASLRCLQGCADRFRAPSLDLQTLWACGQLFSGTSRMRGLAEECRASAAHESWRFHRIAVRTYRDAQRRCCSTLKRDDSRASCRDCCRCRRSSLSAINSKVEVVAGDWAIAELRSPSECARAARIPRVPRTLPHSIGENGRTHEAL